MNRIKLLMLIMTLVVGEALAQSYLVKSNGAVLNIADNGQVFDRGQFILPYQIRQHGGAFYIGNNGQITTVNDEGFFFRIDTRRLQAPREIRLVGYNYFIAGNNVPWVVDSQGTVYQAQANIAFREIHKRGGNFIISGGRRYVPRLFVVTDRGDIIEPDLDGLDLNKVQDVGGNWFTIQGGTVYTISRDGYVYSKRGTFPRIPSPELIGGNYFVVNNRLITVADDGLITDRGNVTSFGAVAKTGYNYYLTSEGRLVTINAKGEVNNRTGQQNLTSIAVTTFGQSQ